MDNALICPRTTWFFKFCDYTLPTPMSIGFNSVMSSTFVPPSLCPYIDYIDSGLSLLLALGCLVYPIIWHRRGRAGRSNSGIQHAWVQGKAALVAKSSGAEYEQLYEYARMLVQFMGVITLHGPNQGPVVRDRNMADNFRRLVLMQGNYDSGHFHALFCSVFIYFPSQSSIRMYTKKVVVAGLFLALTFGLTACQDELNQPVTPGGANFTRYVAIGNSLTAGYADNGLYRSGQLNSYPSILAGQFKTAGGGDFVQPLFDVSQANGSGYLKLTKLPASLADLATVLVSVPPQAVRGLNSAGGPLLTKFAGTGNQNLGVPGIRLEEILAPGYGSALGNPFFERLLPDNAPLTTTYLDYVSSSVANATFFSCWIGNNDALNYGTSGGTRALTDLGLFTSNFTTLLNKLTENGRKGVVIGIPAISTLPDFNTITVAALLAQINAAVQPPVPITALVIQSPFAPGGVRATKAGDLLLLESLGEYPNVGRTDVGTKQGPYGLSPTNPLPTQHVLDAEEVAALNARTAEYNTVMLNLAQAKGLAVVNPNDILNRVGQGLTENGITYTPAYISGGVFSLDGVHLTPAGYALIANEMIRAINTKYGTTVPTVDASRYDRVVVQ